MTIATTNFLKRDYLDIVQKQSKYDFPLLDKIESMGVPTTPVSGEKGYFLLDYGNAGGLGIRADGSSSLPTAVQGGSVQASEDVLANWLVLNSTVREMKMMRDTAGVWEDYIVRKVKGGVEKYRFDNERQLFMDAVGKLGRINENPVSGAFPVDEPGGDTNLTGTLSAFEATNFFEVGQRVSGTSNLTLDAIVSDVDHLNGTIRLSATTSLADNDYLYINGNDSTGEMNGLAIMIGTATLHGVNPTNPYSWWQSYVSSSAVVLTDADVLTALMSIGYLSAEEPNLAVCTQRLLKKYAIDLSDNRRYNLFDKLPKAYPTGLLAVDVSGHPVFAARRCTPRAFYWLNTNHIKKIHPPGEKGLQWRPGTFNEATGEWLTVAGADKYEATAFELGNFIATCRNGSGKLLRRTDT